MAMREVAVIGAGVSGLAAAFRLQQAGFKPKLFEGSDHVGGRTLSTTRDGFIIDRGAGILPSRYTNLLKLVEEAGLGHILVPASGVFGFGQSDGSVTYLSAERQLRDALKFPLSTRSKITAVKLLVDAARSSRKLSFEDLSLAASLDTESAGDYARRRLNTELLERLVDPTVRGLAGTTADDISNVDFFFALLKFLGSKFVAFRDGMCSYSTELSARFDVELNALVSHVEEIEDHVEVHWSDANGVERHSEAAGCVLAVPASQVPSLYPQMDLWRSEFLDGVRYTKLVGVHVALSKPPKNVPAACVLLPKAVHPGLIAMVLEHLKAPGRAPAGKGLVGFFTDNGWAEELMDSDDDVVIKELVSGGERFLPGVSNDIEFAVVSRWNEVVLHARPGHYGGLRTFVELSKSKDKLIQLGGDFFSSANVNTATAGGERAARDLLAVLRIRSG